MSQALPIGTRLEEYVIEETLGFGGFGMTYKALDTNLNKYVVIKENLPGSVACREPGNGRTVVPIRKSDAEIYQWSVDNFKREANLLAAFKHPNIVEVSRLFAANGTAYYVMPFINGYAFDKIIENREKEGRRFGLDELESIVNPILSALEILHSGSTAITHRKTSQQTLPVYHRDVKPANILITESDGGTVPLLIDFGSAREFVAQGSHTMMETIGYTPLELIQSTGNVGPWSDLYGLAGCVYRAILFEDPPRAADRLMKKDPTKILSEDKMLVERYGAGFLSTIDRALDRDEKKRPQTVDQWRKGTKAEILEGDEAQGGPMVGYVRSPYGSRSFIEVTGHYWRPGKKIVCPSTNRSFTLPNALPELIGRVGNSYGLALSPYSSPGKVSVSVFEWKPRGRVTCPETGMIFLLPESLPEWDTLAAQVLDDKPGFVNSPYVKDGEFKVDPGAWKNGGEVVCPFSNKSFRLPKSLPLLHATIKRPGEFSSPYDPSEVYRVSLEEWIPGMQFRCRSTDNRFQLPLDIPEWIPEAKIIPGRPGWLASPYDGFEFSVKGEDWEKGKNLLCPSTGKPVCVPENISPLTARLADKPGFVYSPYLPEEQGKIRIPRNDWVSKAKVCCSETGRPFLMPNDLSRLPDHRWVFVLVSVLLLLGVAGGAWALINRQPDPIVITKPPPPSGPGVVERARNNPNDLELQLAAANDPDISSEERSEFLERAASIQESQKKYTEAKSTYLRLFFVVGRTRHHSRDRFP